VLRCLCIQDEVLLLDPPSLIFITRLHLMSVARRKAAGSAAGRSTAGSGHSRQHGPRIPPPVPLPEWAQQELASTSRACSSTLQQEQHAGRRLLDAPDVLCCPITGQVWCGAVLVYPILLACLVDLLLGWSAAAGAAEVGGPQTTGSQRCIFGSQRCIFEMDIASCL
jgi:hypothetical protein